VKDIADGCRAAVAINGGFFAYPGTSLSMVMQNGIITAPPELHRPAFMVLQDGSYRMDYPMVRATVSSANGTRWEADVVNQRPGPGHIALLTPNHPERLRGNMDGTKAIIHDDVVESVTQGDIDDFSERTILWSREVYRPLWLLSPGEIVSINFHLDRSSPQIQQAIQGGPFLLWNGQVRVSAAADDIGGDIANGRSARTGIGYDNSGKIYFVVVESPASPNSIGSTLEELAWTFQDLGATWAMNLDGGGSSAMALGFTDPDTPLPSGGHGVATALVLIDETGGTQGREFHF
jgi:hypothetical protein